VPSTLTEPVDPDLDPYYVNFSWGDGSSSSWIGPFLYGETAYVNHIWDDVGFYDVKVQAKDIYEVISGWSEIITIEIWNNEPDEPPESPDGPFEGDVGEDLTYSTSMDEPDNDMVQYGWDWGDGSPIEWTSFYPSGQTVETSHVWTKEGYYLIRVMGKDLYNASSEWSQPHVVYISEVDDPVLRIEDITGGLGLIQAVIENIGDGDATNVNWSISVKGGIIGGIDVSAGGIIETSEPRSEELVNTDAEIRGLGLVDIAVSAECNEGSSDEKTAEGIVLGKLVFVLGFTLI
jgi:hypothetical protein